MRDRPDAVDLLAIARRRLLEEVLPALPADQRYNALMVAAAMGIAGREAENGDAGMIAEREALVELLAPQGDGEPSLDDLNRRFAEDLRAGEFDNPGPRRDAATRLLSETTLARLGECNPNYLKNDE